MSNRSITLDDALYEYLTSVSLREPDVLRRLRQKTVALPQHNMQIAPEQGQFMALLVELTGARKCLEIGTFTGYSALSVACKLPAALPQRPGDLPVRRPVRGRYGPLVDCHETG